MRHGAQGWCTGMTLRDGMVREVRGRIRMGNTCTPWLIHVNVWQKLPQYCKVISLQLKYQKKDKIPREKFISWRIKKKKEGENKM